TWFVGGTGLSDTPRCTVTALVRSWCLCMIPNIRDLHQRCLSNCAHRCTLRPTRTSNDPWLSNPLIRGPLSLPGRVGPGPNHSCSAGLQTRSPISEELSEKPRGHPSARTSAPTVAWAEA